MSEPSVDRFCPGCGYNLRGIASGRCPECGLAFDPNEPTEPQIPWSHRATLGRRKAFWRTVRLATFHTADFAREINRPVSLPDALAFRRAVVWHAFVPMALGATAGYVAGFELYDRAWYPNDVLGSLALWIGLPVMLASLWLFLFLLFGVLSYFYHPKRLPVRQQNRAVALSYYACAPWAYVFIVLLLAAVYAGVMLLADSDRRQPPILLIAIMSLVCAVPMLIWMGEVWFVPQRMLHRTTQCETGTLALIGFVVRPVVFLLLLLLTVGLLNAGFWGIALMVLSLR